MNNIFGMPGEYLRGVGARSTGYFSGGNSNIILYLIAAIAIVVVLVMLSGTQINWSAFDPRPRKLVVATQSYKYWMPSAQYTNLVVDKDAPEGLKDNTYSVAVEMKLMNTRNYGSTEGPYRHLCHRGSDELLKSTVGGAVLSGCGSGSNNNALPKFGLPKRLNPGIFLDPNTNDVLVFVDTMIGNEVSRESVRIADIPLDTPFRLGVVLNGRVLEVYLNCKLEVTKVLLGEPKSVENVWYGLAGGAAAQAMVQNLRIWKSELTADDMRTLCPSLPTFPVDRPICNGADTVIQSNGGAATRNINIDLGFSNTIQKCGQ